MKSVLFLIPSLGGGGAERVLVNLVNNLDKTKYKISVQTLFDVGVNKQYLNESVEYIPGFRKQISGNVMLFKLFSPEYLYKHLIKKRYDIVVSYLEGPAARIVAGCPYDSKLVSWVHVEQGSTKLAAYSYRSIKEYQSCCERFDRTVCVAETVKKNFLSTVTLTNPCLVLYNTNEDKEILSKATLEATFPTKKNCTRVISVARLRPEKGFDRLILVHKKLLEEGIQHEVFVLGEGTERKKLESLITEEKVEDTFHLLGFDLNPYKYISKADLYVCSSFREGFSTAVTEALILGIPVVSTNCSGAYELLGEQDEYGIVTENTTEGIYEGMHKMLSTPGLLANYREQARKRGLRFSKEKTVQAVEEMFEQLFVK